MAINIFELTESVHPTQQSQQPHEAPPMPLIV